MYMPMHPRHRATTGRGSGHLRTPPKFRSRNRTRAPSRASAAPGSPSLAPSAAPSSGAARGAVLVVRVVEEPSKRSDLVRVDQQHPLVPVVRVVEESSKRSETLSELISSTLLVPGRLFRQATVLQLGDGLGRRGRKLLLVLDLGPLAHLQGVVYLLSATTSSCLLPVARCITSGPAFVPGVLEREAARGCRAASGQTRRGQERTARHAVAFHFAGGASGGLGKTPNANARDIVGGIR